MNAAEDEAPRRGDATAGEDTRKQSAPCSTPQCGQAGPTWASLPTSRCSHRRTGTSSWPTTARRRCCWWRPAQLGKSSAIRLHTRTTARCSSSSSTPPTRAGASGARCWVPPTTRCALPAAGRHTCTGSDQIRAMETTDGSDELPRRTVLGTCDLTLLPRIRVFAGHRPVGALPRRGGPDHVAVPQAASSLVVRPPDLQRWRDYTYLVATRTSAHAGAPYRRSGQVAHRHPPAGQAGVGANSTRGSRSRRVFGKAAVGFDFTAKERPGPLPMPTALSGLLGLPPGAGLTAGRRCSTVLLTS